MGELDDAVYEVSAAAFELAKESASGGGATAEQQAKALELAERVNALMPDAEARAAHDQTLVRELTDARLDIGWVYSGGRSGASTRLFYHLKASETPG
jgi:hypothetical protein